MIPPYSMQFALWGSAVYAGLAAGLWRALATPWLEAGQPARHESRAGATDAAARSVAGARIPIAVAEEPPSPKPTTGRVIEVPPARWRDRRAGSASSAADR